jgi:isocitrate dehydrogenase (NAD+)
VKKFEGIQSRFEDVDLIIVRENTEDLYSGIEHMITEDVAESIKIFTRKGCERIITFAFEHARKEGRKKVTAVHKANIMKCTDGMFLDIARSISKEYGDIEFEDMIIDAMCMRLVQSPENYDVLVLPNLYGDIVSDLCTGLVGGLGIVPGVNIGIDMAIFEPIHGSAPNISGKNIANPTAMMLSGVHMLRYMGELETAIKIEKAISKVFQEGKSVTCDLGETASTTEFTEEVLSAL